MSGDRTRVTVSVAVPVERAFELFTQRIDDWWRRGPQYRHLGDARGIMHIEPHVGGRLFESYRAGAEERAFEVGRVSVWTPPSRLVFSWRNANFAPKELTEVEVEFAGAGDKTTVTVTHRGWAALRADHPARHGLTGAEFSRMIGLWWAGQLTALRAYASDSRMNSRRPEDG